MKFMVEMNNNDFEEFKKFLNKVDSKTRENSLLQNIKEMFYWEDSYSGDFLNLIDKVTITLIED